MKNQDTEWTDEVIGVLRNSNDIITNLDLDGALCAAIVCKNNSNAVVSGFNNSNTRFYKKKGLGNGDMLCLDFFCTKDEIACIDNHIISTVPMPFKNKYNPNVVCGVSLADYNKKYPFSTFVLLCALYDRAGGAAIDIDAVVGKYENEYVFLWELLLRADDTLYTTAYSYIENSENWWKWILSISGKNGNTWKLYEKCRSFKGNGNLTNAEKNRINNFLKQEYKTTTKDGFSELDWNYYTFLKKIGNAFGVKLNVVEPTELELHLLTRFIYKTSNIEFMKSLIVNEKPFSYSFTQNDTISVSVWNNDFGRFNKNLRFKPVFIDVPNETHKLNINCTREPF